MLKHEERKKELLFFGDMQQNQLLRLENLLWWCVCPLISAATWSTLTSNSRFATACGEGVGWHGATTVGGRLTAPAVASIQWCGDASPRLELDHTPQG
jgi:hypothetical protein